jgi:hypothetical protein
VGSRRDLVRLGLLLLAVVLLTVLLGDPTDREAPADPRPSSFLTTPQGTRALHDLLRELRVPVGRRLSPYADADSLAGPLVLIAPSVPVTPEELHALAEWIRAGGTLVYAAGRGERELRDTLGLGLVTLRGDTLTATNGRDSARVATAAPHPWTAGVRTVDGFRRVWNPKSRAMRTPGAAPLLTTGGRPVATVFPLGRGRVVAWSDATPLTNERLRRSGAGLLFARAAAEAAAGGRTVRFDEYHHGFSGGGSAIAGTFRFLRDRPLGHAAVQLGVALAGLILLAGRRFGAPVPMPPARRRSPLEHVEALAGAYRQGGARRTARRLLLAGLARRMGRPPAREGEADAVERLTTFAGAGPAAGALRDEWNRGDAADLVALSRNVDRLLEEAKRK